MLTPLFYFVIGLVVGWFFLPTPQWARNLMASLVTRYPWLAFLLRTGSYTSAKPSTTRPHDEADAS